MLIKTYHYQWRHYHLIHPQIGDFSMYPRWLRQHVVFPCEILLFVLLIRQTVRQKKNTTIETKSILKKSHWNGQDVLTVLLSNDKVSGVTDDNVLFRCADFLVFRLVAAWTNFDTKRGPSRSFIAKNGKFRN